MAGRGSASQLLEPAGAQFTRKIPRNAGFLEISAHARNFPPTPKELIRPVAAQEQAGNRVVLRGDANSLRLDLGIAVHNRLFRGLRTVFHA